MGCGFLYGICWTVGRWIQSLNGVFVLHESPISEHLVGARSSAYLGSFSID